MGGGDLNMKKSWHPLLMKNQERVWLEEKKALTEKKKLDQLRKELEEERQLQELQRLQEEQTGKKRQDKLEWMYATPATGGSSNANDLEDYLLGKKRVDKMLIGDENKQVGASHKNFIAVQNANTARDVAAKIREDPLLAIKQQEQAAYQALISNPLRLKAMKEKAGIKDEKEHKKRKKHKHRHTEEEDHKPPERRRSDEVDDRDRRSRYNGRYRSDRSLSPAPRRSLSPPYEERRRFHSESPGPDRHPGKRPHSPSPTRGEGSSYNRRRLESNERDPRRYSRSPISHPHRRSRSPRPYYGRSPSPRREVRRRERSLSPRCPSVNGFRDRSPPLNSKYANEGDDQRRHSAHTPPRERLPSPTSRPSEPSRAQPTNSSKVSGPSKADLEAARLARLAQMSADAETLNSTRATRLAAIQSAERAEHEKEEAARRRNGPDGKGSFMRLQEKMIFGGGMGLEERLKRGRVGLVKDGE